MGVKESRKTGAEKRSSKQGSNQEGKGQQGRRSGEKDQIRQIRGQKSSNGSKIRKNKINNKRQPQK